VTVSWEHAYGECVPATAAILRVVAVLDLEVIAAPSIGAAAGLTQNETAASLADLTRTGWAVRVNGGSHAMVDEARAWLTERAPHLVEPAEADRIARRFTEFLTTELPNASLAAYRREVIAALRASDRDGLRGLGARLANTAWPGAAALKDPAWWAELSEAGETLAIADQDPAMLTDLLHHSASTFADDGDRTRAEAQWVRALAIIRSPRAQGGDPERGAAVLAGLAELYRDWGRLSKALDADLALVDLRRAAGDSVGTAEALATVAGTMHAAGRLNSAAEYLASADNAMSTAPVDTPDLVTAHARILVLRGRALWELGQHASARRPWSRALAMLIDVDDDAAGRVRALLATKSDEPLPR
jgi:tetratricopeptide (TPR) repeat protein